MSAKKKMFIVVGVKAHWVLDPQLHNQQLIIIITVIANQDEIYSKSKYYKICRRDEEDVYKAHT